MTDGAKTNRSSSLQERFVSQYDASKQVAILTDRPPFPKNMMVELSNACNHACIFCTSSSMTRKISRIDKDLLFSIMQQAHDGGVREIGFYTTGEPFVHKDLEKFIAQAKAIGFSYIYISTNGAMADEKRAKKAIDAGLNSIKFSINAGSRETYKMVHGYDDWDKVIRNLKFISAYRSQNNIDMKLFVTFIVTKYTQSEIDAFRNEFSQYVDEIMFHPVHNQSGQMVDVKDLVKSERKLTDFKSHNVCMMPFNRLHVTCEGLLTICCVDYQNYLIVADLKSQSLRDAWENENFRAIRQRHLSGDLQGTLCGNCWQARRDVVQPLAPQYATQIDFPKFYETSASKVSQRAAPLNKTADSPPDER